MRDARHRLDAARVDFAELFDPGEDLRQLAGEPRLFLFGHPYTRQGGNPRHGGLVQCHAVDVSSVAKIATATASYQSYAALQPCRIETAAAGWHAALGIGCRDEDDWHGAVGYDAHHRDAARYDSPHPFPR